MHHGWVGILRNFEKFITQYALKLDLDLEFFTLNKQSKRS